MLQSRGTVHALLAAGLLLAAGVRAYQRSVAQTKPAPADQRGAAQTRPAPANQTAVSCQHCHVRDTMKHIRIEAIKAQILQMLGMSQAPNMTGRKLPVVSDALIQFYLKEQRAEDEQNPRDQQYAADEHDEDHSQPEKIWTFASRSPLAEGGGPLAQDRLRDTLLYFDLSEDVTLMDLEQATLWLFVRGARHRKRFRSIEVKIQQMVLDRGNYILKEVMTKKIRPHHKQGYVRIAVKELVLNWFRFPHQNYGIIIETKNHLGNLTINSFQDVREGDGDALPVLEVHISSDRRRTKRTTGGNFCTDNSTETDCCRFPLVVDFHVFGWDWIIAPISYRANYCSGNCPYVYLQKYPHTHIVQQVGGTSGPCCGPRKLSPIHMLYWDSLNHIRFDKLPNMIVDSCGCH